MSEARCEVCGEPLDEWGCLGEFRGKHVPIEMEKLRARIAYLESRLDLPRTMEKAGSLLRRMVCTMETLAGEWDEAAESLRKEWPDVEKYAVEHARADSYEECAEELRKEVEREVQAP